MKISACETSLDSQIHGKGYWGTFQCRHTALQWQRPAPRCEVLPEHSVLQTSRSLFNRTRQAFHPRAHTCGPHRQPPLPSSCGAPRGGGVGGRSCWPGSLHPVAPSLSAWQLGVHTPFQEQMPHGRFPLTWSVPSPEKDQGEGSEAPSACSGPQISRALSLSQPRVSLAALSHMPEELLALLVTEAPQAVRALKVSLPSPGRSALGGGVQPLRSSPRPPATGCHELQSIRL